MNSFNDKILDVQSKDGGSNPTFTLQDLWVELCDRNEIKEFIEKWHYSKNINGIKSSYCFKITYNNEIIGASIFGLTALNSWKKYVKNQNDIIELRRLVCVDNTPKNIESFFISKCIKWLKKNTYIKVIISYADLTYGHSGIIYKASNFKEMGLTKPGRMIQYNNKLYHDKTIRTKYNGKLKPYAQKIKNALLNGSAQYINTKSKIIFIYNLR